MLYLFLLYPLLQWRTESCPLCIFHNTRCIHFIFTHLINQLQKVCHFFSYLIFFQFQNLNFCCWFFFFFYCWSFCPTDTIHGDLDQWSHSWPWPGIVYIFYQAGAILDYRQVSNIRRTWVGNEIVDHSDVVGASPVGAAPTTSSFFTEHLASIYCVNTNASWV